MNINELRSGEALQSLITYCYNNPNQRLWQAIRNWSRYERIHGIINGQAEETYNFEGLEGSRNYARMAELADAPLSKSDD